MPIKKRLIELCLVLALTPVWLTLFLMILGIMAVTNYGEPFYCSARRVSRCKIIRIRKFRSMDPAKVRRLARLSDQDSIGFLSIDPSSGVYTAIGRVLEALKLVELPELFYVIRGDLGLVGNRPLPESIVSELASLHPDFSSRFDMNSGIFSIAHVVGRAKLTNIQRLELECIYCNVQSNGYSLRLDLYIVFWVLLNILTRSAFARSYEQCLSYIELEWGIRRRS